MCALFLGLYVAFPPPRNGGRHLWHEGLMVFPYTRKIRELIYVQLLQRKVRKDWNYISRLHGFLLGEGALISRPALRKVIVIFYDLLWKIKKSRKRSETRSEISFILSTSNVLQFKLFCMQKCHWSIVFRTSRPPQGHFTAPIEKTDDHTSVLFAYVHMEKLAQSSGG